MILSSTVTSFSSTSARVRVSSSSSSSSSPLLITASNVSILQAPRSSRRRWWCPSRVEFCPSNSARGMAHAVDEIRDSAAAAASASAAIAAAATSSSCPPASEKPDHFSHSRTFLDLRSEEDLLSGIKKEAEVGKLPSYIAQAMEELYYNYRNAIFQSGQPKADETVLYNMAVALDCILKDVKEPFEFSPYHKAVREPFDYYMFGQNYIRPLIDFRSSYVGNISVFSEMEEKLHQGENIVLMSNHQTEADPAIIALLLESTNPYLAENMIYIAGDRVITDPLCKPFSMGRNLLCVYSKKHMFDIPELVEMKKRANTRSLKEMAMLLRGGSKIIWIAPSGGRDRPDPVTKEWYPAPFDASSADNMRRLVEHAGVPGHIYPLTILCHDIMPPPAQVEKEIGEKRVISFHGAGVSVAPEISFHEVAGALKDAEEAKMAYSRALYDSVNQQYDVLKSAIHSKRGLQASTPLVTLSQPWQ